DKYPFLTALQIYVSKKTEGSVFLQQLSTTRSVDRLPECLHLLYLGLTPASLANTAGPELQAWRRPLSQVALLGSKPPTAPVESFNALAMASTASTNLASTVWQDSGAGPGQEA
ncbi:hypothetical protein BOX15_Mlig010776g1, partial [Macrostomum lignano]